MIKDREFIETYRGYNIYWDSVNWYHCDSKYISFAYSGIEALKRDIDRTLGKEVKEYEIRKI